MDHAVSTWTDERTVRRLSVLLPLLLMVAGCASCTLLADSPRYADVASLPASDGRAVVCIYRNHAEPTGQSTAIHVGDRHVARLDQRTFTRIELAPGTHTIRSRWIGPLKQSESWIEIDAAAATVRYLEVAGIFASRIVTATAGGTQVRDQFGASIREVDATRGAATLEECCFYRAAEARAP